VLTWSEENDRPADDRVAEIARRKGCLDYRSLLKTNFLHSTDEVNLFELVVEDLLADCQLTHRGQEIAVRDLWERVLATVPPNHRGKARERAQAACDEFNMALDVLLDQLREETAKLLREFHCRDVSVGFLFHGVDYDETERDLAGRFLCLDVDFRGEPFMQHHNLLNEARLSAIALSLYFAGLLVSTPPPPPDAPDYPKLLVLDDVLIGLDMSNRLPVLDILERHFAERQIILMTYDRTWFEIVKARTQGSRKWEYAELLVSRPAEDAAETPFVKPSRGYLATARKHMAMGDLHAAALYARMAFETKLRKYCSRKSVRVPFKDDPSKVKAEHLLQAVEERLRDGGKWDEYEPMLDRVKASRRVVLNPLSHAGAYTVCRAEVAKAIEAVDALRL